jgi:hypothetical protein
VDRNIERIKRKKQADKEGKDEGVLTFNKLLGVESFLRSEDRIFWNTTCT